MTNAMQHTAHAVARDSFLASARRLVESREGARDTKLCGSIISAEALFSSPLGMEGYRDEKSFEKNIELVSTQYGNHNTTRIALLPRSPRQPLDWQPTMVKPGDFVELV